MLVVTGQMDNIVPFALANAAYKKQRRNASPTEIVEIPGVGHSLVVDHSWATVAEAAYGFVQRHGF